MPKAKKQKSALEDEKVIDSFESWLKHQKPTNVKARAGFTSGEEKKE